MSAAPLIRYVDQPPLAFGDEIEDRRRVLSIIDPMDDIYARRIEPQNDKRHRKRYKTEDQIINAGSVIDIPLKKIQKGKKEYSGIKLMINRSGEKSPLFSLSVDNGSRGKQSLVIKNHRNREKDIEMSIPIIKDKIKDKYLPVYFGLKELHLGFFSKKIPLKKLMKMYSDFPLIRFLFIENSNKATLAITVFSKGYDQGYIDYAGWHVRLRKISSI